MSVGEKKTVRASAVWRWLAVLAVAAGGAFSFYRSPPAPSVRVDTEPAACRLADASAPVLLERCTTHLDNAPPGFGPPTEVLHAPLRRWLAIRLHNPGPGTAGQVLDLGVPDALALWVQPHNSPPVLTQDPTRAFGERPLPHPRLVVPLRLAPGVTTLAVGYTVHGNGKLTPTLTTADALLRDGMRHDLANGLMLGALLTLMVVGITYSWATRQQAYRLYGPLILAEMLMLLQTEGYAFALWWPHWPVWNSVAPLVIGGAVLALHVLFAIEFLQLRQRYPRLFRLHLAVVVGVGVNLCLAPGLAFELGVMAAAVLYCPLAYTTGARAVRDRVPGAPLYVLGMAWLFFFGGVLFPLGVVGLNPFPVISHFDYPKFGLLIEAVCFSAAIIIRLRQIQAQQAEQRMRRLAEAQELLSAEQARREADARARDKSLQLAGASHDLSQPLASLRFAAEALKAQAHQEPIARHLERTLTHAQSLLRSLIDDSRDGLPALSDELDLDDLLTQWLQDHQPAALARRVQLRRAPTRLRLQASGLVLGRIAHNLLGNAVRHSGRGGRVLLGVRRRQGGVELQVLDTGPGLTAAQIERLQRPFVQGEGATEGHGLGLHIVQTLCTQAGYRFLIRSRPGKGSCFAVFIPHPEAGH